MMTRSKYSYQQTNRNLKLTVSKALRRSMNIPQPYLPLSIDFDNFCDLDKSIYCGIISPESKLVLK